MITTIKSPFIPLLLKQKIMEDDKEVGFLKATKLVHQFKSHQSYQINYKGHIIKVIENKKKNGARNWRLLLCIKGRECEKAI
ncbi:MULTISPECIES: hypothetical protein [Paraliobacillus]|uniref:hypothetical protein n=1 Tax=Paraliobacillus TaxID=200903 RepID=UPI000DD3B283|nr:MULTISPECIES: hypothetical protein [Paraliobacillus]